MLQSTLRPHFRCLPRLVLSMLTLSRDGGVRIELGVSER
jgi:hypothetical protein